MSGTLEERIVAAMARASGWDTFDDAGRDLGQLAEEVAKAEREAALREALIFADCFEAPAGQKALALLRAKTIDRPPAAEELAERDPAAFALGQARRQGAANLIFQILSALDVARGIEKDVQNG